MQDCIKFRVINILIKALTFVSDDQTETQSQPLTEDIPAAELKRGTNYTCEHKTDKDVVSDSIADQAMHPHSAEVSGKQTNSGELCFKEIITLLSALVGCDPGTISKMVHNYFICCERKCPSLINEQAAVKTDKSKDKFKHYWLTGQYWWACFVKEGEAKGVYFLLCHKHHSKSILNKTCNTFIDLASKRYKLPALSQHSNLGSTPRVSKMNTFRNYQLYTYITKRKLRSTTLR